MAELVLTCGAFLWCIQPACDIHINGRCMPAGGGKMTWKQLTENDCHEWKLNEQQSIPKKGTTRDSV